MADLSITMHGDASGAADALKHVGHEAGALHEVLEGALKGALGSTVATFSSLETVAEKAAEVVKDFFKESIAEYAKAEAAHRQLKFVAGELTEAFEKQAEVIGENLAIKAEDVEHMQALLLRYGAAPAVIGDAVLAIENYARATGQDANSAMMMFIRGVESGHGSLGRMGVKFDATGDQAHDFAAAVDALNKKLGGVAETEADGLTGRMRGAEIAMDDLKKSFGGFFAAIESKLHVLEAFSTYVKIITSSGNTTAATFAALALVNQGNRPGAAKEAIPGVAGEAGGAVGGGGGGASLEFGELSITPSASAVRQSEKNEEEHLNAYNKWQDAVWVAAETARKKDAEATAQAQKTALEEEEKYCNEQNKIDDARWLAEAEGEKKHQDELRRIKDKAEAEQTARFKAEEKNWERAGDAMGAALVNAIGTQMMRLAEGGDVDPAGMAGDIVSTILSILGTAVGTYFGAPAVGGAIGGLAGGLAKAGIVAEWGRKATQTPKHHDGGWIERFHSGGWPGLGSDEQLLIGQTGERMLSRRQVTNMGGPAAVDAAARGGARGMTVNISTMDSESLTDSFGRNGGRGIFDSIRVGRGDLPTLFR